MLGFSIIYKFYNYLILIEIYYYKRLSYFMFKRFF